MIDAKGTSTTSVPRGHAKGRASAVDRDADPRRRYAEAALAQIPRLLGAVDRNPFRPTFGCLDRQFWHYRTSAFPSEMYQEGVLPLALAYAYPLPGNRWHGDESVRQWAIAALRFSARSAHRDGSCDDYYPYERALGAAVFSLAAATKTYSLLKLDDADLITAMCRRADWLIGHDESGRLANHQALAALGLARLARITGQATYAQAAEARVRRVLAWQSSEGWFEEYGGADPGYQTVTIDALAKYRRIAECRWLDEPLKRAVEFCGWFLHPDFSYAGEYGSRGTYHFYPHGFELLAGENHTAAALADGFLEALRRGKIAALDDDRLLAHRLGNLIEAYHDWSPRRATMIDDRPTPRRRLFGEAGLLVRKSSTCHTVVSAARGGVFKHFVAERSPVTDAGLIVELADGRVAVSQSHDRSRETTYAETSAKTTVTGPLHFVRFETVTVLKQAMLHVVMVALGRFCRGVVRKLLQRRLITGRRGCPIRFTRELEFIEAESSGDRRDDSTPSLRVTDQIELLDRRLDVRRMSYGTDHQTAYVAASGVYQDSVRHRWTDLSEFVQALNTQRQVTIVREF